MASADIRNAITVDGSSYTKTQTIPADGIVRKEKAGASVLAAAKVGQLTTRTDNDTGTLTMNPGHGIGTGNRLDVYWTEGGVKGARRGMTVGTVSGDSVPIDGGAGDNLPTNLTAVTAQVPASENFAVVGNDVQFIFAKASRRGIIVFADGSNVELAALATEIQGDSSNNGYQWYTGSGITNPLSGDTVVKVFFSNGDSTGTNEMIVGVGFN